MSLVTSGGRAIVPYGKYAMYVARNYSPAVRKARMAYQVGRGAIKAARVAYKFKKSMVTGRSKKRENRRKKRAAMRRVGEPVGSSNSKWDALNAVPTTMNPETLYQVALLDVTKVAGSSSYDRRLKDQLNFRGIKFCMNFRVESAIGTAKAWLNVAVISPKSDLASNQAIPNTDFFRDPGGATRAADFGIALNNMEFRCSSINTDKYNIHSHKRMIVGPSQATEGNRERLIEWWLPVKRQIRYNDATAYPEGKNIYLVWWFATSDNGTPAASMQYNYHIKRYFRESVGI